MRDDFGNERRSEAVNLPHQPNYTTSNDLPVEAGKVIALAGGAAGALAGLWVLVSERNKEPEPKTTLEQARAMLEEAADKARKESATTGASLKSTVESFSSNGKKKGKKKKKGAKSTAKLSRKAQSDRKETMDKVAKLLKDAREDTKKAYDKSGIDASSLLHQAEQKLGDARKLSATYSSQAKKDADRARGELSTLAEVLRSKAHEAEHVAEGFVGSVVLPKLTELGHEAQTALVSGKGKTGQLRKRAESDLLPEARKRAGEIRKKAEGDLLPEAKKRVEELRKRAEADVLPDVKKKADGLTHSVEDRAKIARKALGANSAKLTAAATTVETQASEASEAVKRGSRETRSLLLWVALAGVLIFTVFLDEEQQKRLKEIAFEIFGEAKDMYADMKGEDSAASM